MSMLGSKAENLIRLRDEFGVMVPDFVVVPFAELIEDFAEVANALDAAVSLHLRGATERHTLKTIATITSAVRYTDAVENLARTVQSNGWKRVSVRTSASLEDTLDKSFAGQYQTNLEVDPEVRLLKASIHECLRGLVSPRVIQYVKAHALTEFAVSGSVVVQEMFYGIESGVVFSENGTGALSVASVPSWRNHVVMGVNATERMVPRHDLDGAEVPAHIRRLCRTTLELERRFGAPVDIEWSYDGRTIAFLQIRAITTPMREYVLDWDSTNISENYPGVTLPLTYSVIRQLYAGVYPAFLRLLGTTEARLRANAAVFDNMLGYVGGHVFYRISNWYEVVKFLPGRANQEFFEAMLNPVTRRGQRGGRRRIDFATVAVAVRFVRLLARSERLSRRFRDSFAVKLDAFESYHVDFINAAAIFDATKRVRHELLGDWAVPILNDVKLMVFHGMLTRFFFDGEHRAEYLEFLHGLSDRASLKPLEALSELGREVERALDATNATTIAELRGTAAWPDVVAAAKHYITRYGARTPGELKLETERLTDHLDDVLELARKSGESTVSSVEPTKAATIWPEHIAPWKRPLLAWVAGHTRRAIDWRERFRFNRAQTFNLARNSFDAIGRSLAAEGVVLTSRDVYWLTEHEVDELVNGHAWSYDAAELVASRQRQFAEYVSAPMPLAIRGAGRIAPLHVSPVSDDGDEALGGNGVAPGELTAEVVVAHEFDAALDVRGKVLVVHHIDPGWTLLFTQAAGIVAERGNALSHAAIIAREIGIPAIVAVAGATERLATGDTITMNGISGSIRRESN
jgi:pyruvate,water dikinase